MEDDKQKSVDKPKTPVATQPTASKSSINKTLKNGAKNATATSMVLVVLVSAGAGFFGGWIGSNRQSSGGLTGSTDKQSQQIINNESQLIGNIAKTVGPSVVSVNVEGESTVQGFFGPSTYQSESAGTGFIIREDGIIVTNRHVVPEGTSNVTVTLSDGTELDDVEVLGRTSENDSLDVAFLKVNDKKGKELKAVTLAESSKVQVGDMVVAIGNALGQFQNTVTSGIISGYGRSVEAGDGTSANTETLQNLFQTDAAINQGNSGGPLVNINGEVIGINTAVAGDGAENIGFAIPVDDVKGLIDSILTKGKIERPYLGIRYVTLTDDTAFQYGLETKRGAFIVPARTGSSIVEGSPAAKAGLQQRDIITKIDGTSIDEKNSLTSIVSRKKVGDEVTLTVVRNGQEQTIKLKLEAAPTS